MNEFTHNRNELIKEAYRLSELALAAEAAAADAADQRAMSFCALLIAGSVGLTAFFAAQDTSIWLLIAAGVLALAAAVAGYSALPADFYYPGAKFDDLSEDIANGYDFYSVIKQLGRFNDKHSRKNRKRLERNAALMTRAFWLAIAGTSFAVFATLMMHYCDNFPSPSSCLKSSIEVKTSLT